MIYVKLYRSGVCKTLGKKPLRITKRDLEGQGEVVPVQIKKAYGGGGVRDLALVFLNIGTRLR
jgi:hypothetical protein